VQLLVRRRGRNWRGQNKSSRRLQKNKNKKKEFRKWTPENLRNFGTMSGIGHKLEIIDTRVMSRGGCCVVNGKDASDRIRGRYITFMVWVA